ncbi:MAG: DNA alkylation repair protein [Flavobacteriales bacterium]|nr:DNA alkylation repair protein [Flavobacteriales bacterium]
MVSLAVLNCRKDSDHMLPFANTDHHSARKEFFIGKAIGWALRELGATDPGAVRRCGSCEAFRLTVSPPSSALRPCRRGPARVILLSCGP